MERYRAATGTRVMRMKAARRIQKARDGRCMRGRVAQEATNSPPQLMRGDCAIKKSREATSVRAGGVVWPRNFRTKPENHLLTNTPPCAPSLYAPPLLSWACC